MNCANPSKKFTIPDHQYIQLNMFGPNLVGYTEQSGSYQNVNFFMASYNSSNSSSVFLEKYDIDGSMTKQVQYAAQTQLYFLSLVQNKTDQFLLVNEFDAASYTVLTTIFSADLTELQMIKFCTSIYCPYSPFAIVYVQDYSLFTYATTTISDVTFHIARVNLFETETSRQNSVFKVICDTNMPHSMSILNITIDQLYSKEYHFILTRDSMQDDSFYLVKTPLSRFDIDSAAFDCKGLFDESTVYKVNFPGYEYKVNPLIGHGILNEESKTITFVFNTLYIIINFATGESSIV